MATPTFLEINFSVVHKPTSQNALMYLKFKMAAEKRKWEKLLSNWCTYAKFQQLYLFFRGWEVSWSRQTLPDAQSTPENQYGGEMEVITISTECTSVQYSNDYASVLRAGEVNNSTVKITRSWLTPENLYCCHARMSYQNTFGFVISAWVLCNAGRCRQHFYWPGSKIVIR
jgi:hypothetical protein